MKSNKILKLIFAVFLIITPNAYSQHDEFENVSLSGNYENNIETSSGEEMMSASVLNQRITLNILDGTLSEILEEISDQSKISFTFDDQLINISGLSFKADDEYVYKVLSELLEPCNISYYEYDFYKVALAKIEKIDEKTGAIKGIVKDESGEILIGANIVLKELGIGSTSDSRGSYIIKNIRPGEYNIEITFIGYERVNKKVLIKAGEVLQINFILKSTSFEIGGIEVIGTTELLPKDVNTKTYITSGEIEHYQASSIKDVLDLVPGVQKTDNPGLGKTTQISVRGDETDKESTFGTLIMVDGIPVSNNANLQFERLSGSKFGNSNLGRGVDLRSIPADNLEFIEVVTGLPSVRYGDVTAGVINIQTKIGVSPHRLKIKNNPDTREGNLGGGFLVGESGLSYNLNYAQSERDIRKTGDEYSRLTGQVVYSSNFFDNSLNINNKINFQTIFDEEEPKGDQQKTKNYNRGFTLGLSTWGKYKPVDGVSLVDYSLYGTMRRENSMKSRLVQSDLRILPNGDTISTYLGKVETKGIEWTAGGRLEWNNIFYTGDFIHKFLIGTDPQYNANTGEGVLFDTLLSIYGADAGRRPYSFNDIPGQFLMNIYAEDKLTGHLLFDFNLMFGFRYEMYRPYKFNIKGLWGDGNLVESHQGTFFNPRANLMVYLSDHNQIRLSAGTTSKSPSMDLIYPPEDVFRWRNPIDSTINYFRYDLRNPELKGFRETQYEVSFDQKISSLMGMSLSAYYKRRTNEAEQLTIPVFNYFELGSQKHIYYIDTYSKSINSGSTLSKGMEFTLRTSKITPLNMEIQIVGAYNFFKILKNIISYKPDPNMSLGQYHNYKVPDVPIDTLYGMLYPSGVNWNDRLQLNYYIKYTHPTLGLWITLRAEQLLTERYQYNDKAPQDYNLLNETQKLVYDFERKINSKPNKWLFSINMSKSLFSGAEVSFYVNNFLDESALYRYLRTPTDYSESVRNPALTYGIEFSMIIDNIIGRGK